MFSSLSACSLSKSIPVPLRMPRISLTGVSILGMMTVSPSRMFIVSSVSFGMIIPRLVPILRIFAFKAILIRQLL